MREKGRVVVKENDGKCVQEMLYARAILEFVVLKNCIACAIRVKCE